MTVPDLARRTYRLLPHALRERVAHARVERSTRRRSETAFKELSGRRGLLLDVGTSSTHLPGWVSLDVQPDDRALYLDATARWPLPDACAAAVRSEHMVEHLTANEVRRYLREAYRVLEPGGVLRTCTPDLEAIVRVYLERDPALLATHRSHGYDAPTWAHFVNNYVYLFGHRFVYDFEALAAMLAEEGFTEVERVVFNASRHSVLAGTDSHEMDELERIVLCVDAVKPSRTLAR
jgi:predicted SAM-dependent methyltransferase